VYGQFQDGAEYAFAEPGIYLSSNEYMLLCPAYDAKCLLAFLNSRAIEWLLTQTTGSLGGNAKIGQKSNFVKLAIPILPQEEQRIFASMVERLLRMMKEGKETESIQSEIDQSIYSLYGLTSEEIALVESKQVNRGGDGD